MKEKYNDRFWLMRGDCLDCISKIKDQSIDTIICDPPYGGSFTQTTWDKSLDWNKLWPHLERIIKPCGAIVLFASQPFTTDLINSNRNLFRYQWFWQKSKVGGFQNAKLKPLKVIEDILVFSKANTANGAKQLINYYPQGLIRINKSVLVKYKAINKNRSNINHYSKDNKYVREYTNYPRNLLIFNSETKTVHASQKPVALMEYLIKTYTKKNQLVLNFTYGSGTTGIACMNTGRQFIGIEKDKHYFKVGYKRIKKAYKQSKKR